MPIPQHAGPRLLLLAALLAPGLAMGTSKPGQAKAEVDPMEASLAGEFALQAGQLPEAARQYLQAARSASDPVLAERATRIALLADEDALARDAFKTWQSLAPAGGEAQQMVAAGLALRAGDKRASRRELRALLADGGKGWRSALAALFGAVGKQQKLVVAMIDGIVDDNLLPDDLQAWLGFGGLAQRLERPALVDRIVDEIVRRYPGEPRVALLRAQLLREGGKLGEARALLAGLEDAAKLSTPLRWSLAGEYDALGDSAKAAQVLGWGAQDDASHVQRAMLLDKAKDKTGLVALYDELKREATHPNPMRRLLLGQLAELLERYEDARSWYANVPGEGVQGIARLRGANVLHAMGRKPAAFDELHAIQSDQTLDEDARRDGYLLEAELRLKDKDDAGELDVYARGLAAFADDEALLYSRALLWERRDEIAKAEADFRRILVISPDDVNTLNALGYTLADRTTRYREALELIDRARVAAPGNAAIIDSYGWVLFRLGKPRQALDHLRHAYALQKDADIGSHLGHVLWVLGEREEARKYFEEARKIDPDNRSLQRALQATGA
ncbi:tetratricopeptide repeat protein [Thermomonas carbonis]|uniref:Tetratricopeptide repeat protein n=1 Tax=Thermomonas carbonis TaxID=1463158 RepID=A0A7G9SM06_9GAMM|nr:tetratricopeptide repeat protein [Thermomonas carbonis]QNN68881.1 tetratricopeptide repeat protein [Thermomonas carbonis]